MPSGGFKGRLTGTRGLARSTPLNCRGGQPRRGRSDDAEQFVGMLRMGVFLRASLGLAVPIEDDIDATVEATVTTFLKAYAA
jgi:AefR-like transcriptional repressor, C-terminal domain